MSHRVHVVPSSDYPTLAHQLTVETPTFRDFKGITYNSRLDIPHAPKQFLPWTPMGNFLETPAVYFEFTFFRQARRHVLSY